MTAIAGFVHDDGSVWIGGDRAGVAGWDLRIREDPKVFLNGEYVFGFTSSFRMGQLLRYAFTPPIPAEGQDISAFMVTTFIDAVRSCLKAGGFAVQDKTVESAGTFLVGFRGRLFRIENDYQVAESRCGYDACGCGDQVVNGAFYALADLIIDPENRIETALRAAERHSAGVRGGFVIEHIEAVKG